MRSASLARLALVLVPTGVLACNALLGDFTVGDGGAPDALTEGSSNDAPTDVANGDANDGGPTLFLLNCAATNGSSVQVNTSGPIHPVNVRVGLLPNDQFHIIVVDYPPSDSGGNNAPLLLHAYVADSHNLGQGFQDLQLQTTMGNNVYDITRYGGALPGWAVLFAVSNAGLNNLYVARFPDAAATWTTPIQVAQENTFNDDSEDATFTVLDGPNDKYYVVFSQAVNTTQTIYGATVTGSTPSALAQIDQITTTADNRADLDLVKPGIVMGGTQPFIMLQPTGDNGPPPLGAAAYILAPPQPAIKLQPPNTLTYIPLAFAGAVNPLNANAAFLTADLTNITGNYNIGQVPVSSLGTLNPQSLPVSTPQSGDAGFSLQNLFISANTQHWEIASGTEQFLVTSTTNDPLTNTSPGGINFGWVDAVTGTLRGYNGGQTNLFRTQAPNVIDSDVTFATLVGSIAQLWVIYSEAQAPITQQYPPPVGDVWLAGVGCSK